MSGVIRFARPKLSTTPPPHIRHIPGKDTDSKYELHSFFYRADTRGNVTSYSQVFAEGPLNLVTLQPLSSCFVYSNYSSTLNTRFTALRYRITSNTPV